MTNEDKIDLMLKDLKELQSNPNFRLHKFEVYEHPEMGNDKIINEVYTTTSAGDYETIDNWYLISNGVSKQLKDVVTDKTSFVEFISSLTNKKYALGGVILN